MKKHYLTIVLLLAFFFSQAQIVDIPDANFKWLLVNWESAYLGNGIYEDVDTNDDGEIQISEAEEVIGLYVQAFEIGTLEGIQSFINLQDLDCGANKLTEIDMSHNEALITIQVGWNQLTSLDLSQNINLEGLYCVSNEITSLDVSNNLNLINIYCYYNQLSTFDITNNSKIEYLFIAWNQLSELNVFQNKELLAITLGYNQLSFLDFPQLPNIERLHCHNNQFTSIDVSQNLNLNWFDAYGNLLTELNIQNGNNINMSIFSVQDNPLLNCIQVDDVEYANNQNWDKDPWAIYSEDCTLGIEDTELSSNFNSYPNPVYNLLTIENTSTSPITSIKVYDAIGRLVMDEEGNTKELDMSSLNSGLLFVKIETDEGVFTKKIIKL